MKTFINVGIPVILTITLVLLLNTGSSSIYGQIIGDTNQTSQTSQLNHNQLYKLNHNQLYKPTQQAQDKTLHNSKLNNNWIRLINKYSKLNSKNNKLNNNYDKPIRHNLINHLANKTLK